MEMGKEMGSPWQQESLLTYSANRFVVRWEPQLLKTGMAFLGPVQHTADIHGVDDTDLHITGLTWSQVSHKHSY